MLFSGAEYASPPGIDQLEVTLIGPGYGEAVLVHIGGGKWILIDSCASEGSSRPASSAYLDDIQVGSDSVLAIIASHWDDDHTKGLSDLVAEHPTADFIISSALGGAEFIAYAAAFDTPLTVKVRAGVREMRKVLKQLAANQRSPKAAFQNRRIYAADDMALPHGLPVELWTLSPSEAEFRNFLDWVAGQMPSVKETRRVAVSRKSNDLSTVVYLTVGTNAMLFGGDLEEEGNPETGWSAILASTGRPDQKSQLFKISHHGSHTGHHDGIWTALLDPGPDALVSPWQLMGRNLPSHSDVERLSKCTEHVYVSARAGGGSPRRRDPAVDRTIRERAQNFKAIPQKPGMVRFRKKAGLPGRWAVELFGGAVHLSRIFD